MPDIVKLISESNALPADLQQKMLENFAPLEALAEQWKEKALAVIINDNSAPAEVKIADTMRKEIKKVRVDIEKTRKSLKDDYLKTGKAIDAIAKSLNGLVEPIENHLIEQSEYFINKEKERIAKLKQERLQLLMPYEPSSYTPIDNIGNYSEDDFNALLEETKDIFLFKQEKAKLEMIERERIEKLRLEELRQFAIEQEKLKAERQQIEADRKRLAELEAREDLFKGQPVVYKQQDESVDVDYGEPVEYAVEDVAVNMAYYDSVVEPAIVKDDYSYIKSLLNNLVCIIDVEPVKFTNIEYTNVYKKLYKDIDSLYKKYMDEIEYINLPF